MARPLASNPVWNESFEELVARWFNSQPAATQKRLGTPAAAAEAARLRAADLMARAALEPAPRMRTLREWETRWNAAHAWKRILEAVRRKGWEAVRHSGGTSDLEMTLAAGERQGQSLILVANRSLEALRDQAEATGLKIPLTVADLAPVALAGELFDLLAEQKANPQKEVETLARHSFIGQALGLPFSFLAMEVIDFKARQGRPSETRTPK